MDQSKLDYLAEEILTQIEREEHKMLRWGFLGGDIVASNKVKSVLEDPPTALMEQLIVEFNTDVADLTEKIVLNLINRKLLFVTSKKSNQYRHRTRFAETIRLMYLLKQRFKFTDWSYAPNLVSNIKMELPYRRYPKRNMDWDNVKMRIKEDGTKKKFSLEVLNQLLEHGQLKLSIFQLDSLSHLLHKPKKDQGTIIGAGTGAGKTKSFYLPSMTKISESIKEDSQFWTRMLGIYPRTELLKDQFKEALSEIFKINCLLKDKISRTITIGSYYGDIPESANALENSPYTTWKKHDIGYICPVVTCLNPKCEGLMVWTYEDLKLEIRHNKGTHERLICVSCSRTIEPENIILTRKRMERTPPDILLTTTEMLNRKLSSLEDQHVFGINAIRAPLFVLLDEVHIYNGVHGAHVSYVLKRWRHLINNYCHNSKIQFVGLSATLPNPQYFFSQLVGINESDCHYISPNEEDMTEEGVEYNLVVRGDPFSSTALLSTSVQAAMLISRMLDPLGGDISRGAWGSKLFGFTDKLDVINRWYHIELDAEKKSVLSKFRDKNLIDEAGLSSSSDAQNKLGQVWNAAKQIDNSSLRNPIKIDITSSQQKGVNANAKLVIATSTLEVGYNDSSVGAIIQHKAPRNLASFMQRKGRAGRKKGMRPWTVVITSAYGRDRFVYEYPEQLYSPVLPDLTLPIQNVYVQRIQAGYAVMDWFALKLKQANYEGVTMWQVLNPKSKKYHGERQYLLELIISILNGEEVEFKQFLGNALQLKGAFLERILWSPPRSIMLNLFPSLYNHLKEDWGRSKLRASSKTDELRSSSAPLSGYVPLNLFSSLSVNEINILTPNQKTHEHSLQQGIIEFAPGNVSKRFVNVNNPREAFWVDPGDNQLIDLENGSIQGVRLSTLQVNNERIEIIMPTHYTLSQIPNLVTDKSSGYLTWATDAIMGSQNYTSDVSSSINLVPNSSLKGFIKNIDVYMSNENRFVSLTRYAYEVSVNKKYINGKEEPNIHCFIFEGKKAAIGFESEVDALVIKLTDFSLGQIHIHPDWDELLAEFKPEYYLHKLKSDNRLKDNLSIFEIEWMWQICFSSTVAVAISMQTTLEEAIEEYQKRFRDISIRSLDVIFQAVAVNSDISGNEESEADLYESKLYKRLLSLIDNPDFIKPCLENLIVLCEDILRFDDAIPWLKGRVKSTLAAVIQKGVENLVPEINTDNIIIDIFEDQIILSESESGGTGTITNVVAALRNYPGKFEELCSHALDYCPRHEIASGLSEIVDHLGDSELNELFYRIRTENRLEEQQELLVQIQKKISSFGVTPKKELIVSLITKLLNSNSNEKTDELMKDLKELWSAEEIRIGCKFDSRIFGVASLRLENIFDRVRLLLEELVPYLEIDEKQIYLLIDTLLWNNCHDSCPECLQLYSPFQSFSKPSRILLQKMIKPSYVRIEYIEDRWQEKVLEVLQSGYSVKIVSSYENISNCRRILLDITNTPIDFHFEHYYPYIAKVKNVGSNWEFDLKVREVSHA